MSTSNGGDNGITTPQISIRVSKELKEKYIALVKAIKSDVQKFSTEIVEILVDDREAFAFMNQKRLAKQTNIFDELIESGVEILDSDQLEILEN